MKTFTSQRGFTLIELLTVITIIAVLASISFPVYSKIMVTVRKTQAKNDAMGIVNAIKNYQAEYAVFPLLPSENQDTVIKTSNTEFMKVLMAEEDGGTKLNTRRIGYFSANPQRRSNGPGMDEELNFYDPWGQFYKIYLDGDYNQKIQLTELGSDSTTDKDVRLEVGVVSAGPPRGDEQSTEGNFTDGNEVKTWQ